MESIGVQHVTVDEQKGQRVDNFLMAQFRKLPRSRIYRMLRSGEVRVNGGRTKAHYRLQAGDQVRLPPVRLTPAAPQATLPDGLRERLADAVLVDNDDLLVVNKPAGIAVHGGSGLSYGLIEALRILHNERLELVHRLDRETSGIIVVAKRRSVLRAWQAAFRPEGNASKQYLVAVAGSWPRRQMSVKRALTKFVTGSGERRVRLDSGGKHAHTDFQRLAMTSTHSVLQASLHTGRTHQIRVHCAASGHSVLGDDKYGSAEVDALSESLGVKRLCLHAARLKATVNGKDWRFVAPVPSDLHRVFAAAGLADA